MGGGLYGNSQVRLVGNGYGASGLVNILEINDEKITDSLGKKVVINKVLVRNKNKSKY